MMPLLAIASPQLPYELGEVVTQQLFIGDHITHTDCRSPFTSSRAWLAARINLYVKDALKVLIDVTLEAEDHDREAASNIMNISMKLLMLLPKLFPSADDEEKDSFVLFNHDLDIQNILVHPDGDLTGVIDWECIHTSPLWHACQLPKFLCGSTQNTLPVESDFMVREDKDAEWELDDMYAIRLRQYEQTQLRKLFFKEMEEVCPEWVGVFRESTLKADFELAVQNIDNDLCSGIILNWAEAALMGEESDSLRDLFRR